MQTSLNDGFGTYFADVLISCFDEFFCFFDFLGYFTEVLVVFKSYELNVNEGVFDKLRKPHSQLLGEVRKLKGASAPPNIERRMYNIYLKKQTIPSLRTQNK